MVRAVNLISPITPSPLGERGDRRGERIEGERGEKGGDLGLLLGAVKLITPIAPRGERWALGGRGAMEEGGVGRLMVRDREPRI